ncbi:hypothetical protein ACP4OV_003024 [Aristida adscensionis]
MGCLAPHNKSHQEMEAALQGTKVDRAGFFDNEAGEIGWYAADAGGAMIVDKITESLRDAGLGHRS